MIKSLVINAPSVYLGGGFVLLSAVLEVLDGRIQSCVILDKRMKVPEGLPESIVVYQVKPTFLGRLFGEWRLRSLAGPHDVVLCFGNLPPLFRLRARVVLFIQNRYLIERRNLKGFPFASRIKIVVGRMWFAWRKRNVTQFIVQTRSMQRTIQEVTGRSAAILPFLKNPKGYRRKGEPYRSPKEKRYDFVYVASGEPHKNHKNMIEAWALLAEEGIRPSLCLTLDENRFAELCHWIDRRKKESELNVSNLGTLTTQQVEELYQRAQALIFPSESESLGLPLIEARCAGIPILASERDYVRDAIDPEETFDPVSPVSIARAVKRFLDIPEPPLPIIDATTYLSKIYEGALG
jgi:glycosyltransferase involved in cell wall biosynthesis